MFGAMIRMHRLVVLAHYGEFTDHVNQDKLDNRKSNLRICTRSENQCNIGLKSNNTSGYKGVSRNGDKWLAEIYVSKQKVHLGRFTCKHEAAKVYNNAALELHGVFACLNEVKYE